MDHGRSWIDTAEAFTRTVNRLFALAGSLLVAAIVVVVVREVVLRYGFNAPSTWALDVARYLLAHAARGGAGAKSDLGGGEPA
jgi:TRAP-type C4-dicarboxylate transport system permease small subunit